MLVIVGEFLSWSVDAGFVLVLPLHHGNLVGEAYTRRGAYVWDATVIL